MAEMAYAAQEFEQRQRAIGDPEAHQGWACHDRAVEGVATCACQAGSPCPEVAASAPEQACTAAGVVEGGSEHRMAVWSELAWQLRLPPSSSSCGS